MTYSSNRVIKKIASRTPLVALGGAGVFVSLFGFIFYAHAAFLPGNSNINKNGIRNALVLVHSVDPSAKTIRALVVNSNLMDAVPSGSKTVFQGIEGEEITIALPSNANEVVNSPANQFNATPPIIVSFGHNAQMLLREMPKLTFGRVMLQRDGDSFSTESMEVAPGNVVPLTGKVQSIATSSRSLTIAVAKSKLSKKLVGIVGAQPSIKVLAAAPITENGASFIPFESIQVGWSLNMLVVRVGKDDLFATEVKHVPSPARMPQ